MAAIYQWFIENVEVSFTTTLYPVETTDAITLTGSLNFIWEWELSLDYAEGTGSFGGGALFDLLLTLPLESDASEGTGLFGGGELFDVLIELPMEFDASEGTGAFGGGELRDILIECYTPDQNIAFSVDVNQSSFVAT